MPKVLKRWQIGQDDVPPQSPRIVRKASSRTFPYPIPQIRVMQALANAKGPLTRVKIAEKIGAKSTVLVGRAIGYLDDAARAEFEQTKIAGGSPGNPCLSLLSRGFLEVIDLSAPEDGINESVYRLSPLGEEAYRELGDIDLPPLRD